LERIDGGMTEAAARRHLHAAEEKKINARTQPSGTRTEEET
jgi:hypothetical protein